MKVRIRYRTDYAYETEVSFSPHTFRIFPKTDQLCLIRKIHFETNAKADIQYRRDIFDNAIAYCFYPEKGSHMKASLDIELELRERNPFNFLVDSYALEIPFDYKPEEKAALALYLKTHTRKVELPFWSAPTTRKWTVSTLVELNEAIFKNIKYERRDEGAPHPPAELLRLGVGACRDFAVLLAETLRRLGVASRLASGYLIEFGRRERRAEGSLHAWAEAYLPGAGWIGFDPTHGILCDHNHIPTGLGVTPADIAPIRGSYFGQQVVPSKMTATVQLEKIAG
jgi:transglutaminase-like putative cysteine protease